MPRVQCRVPSESVALDGDQGCFKQLYELSPDPTWIIEDNHFVECNDAAIRTLGFLSREELLNVHPSKLSPPTQPDGEDSYVKAERMMALAKDNGLHRFEWMHTKADGTNFVAEVTLSAIQLPGRHVIYCVWRDITERKQMEQQIRQLAFYDPLTKLPNRRLLSDRVSKAMVASKRSARYGALIFFDLDDFKSVNDGHGHAVGDSLLIEVARRLTRCVREIDTVARFGGDEFIVLVDDLDEDEAESKRQATNVAQKIQSVMSQPFRLTVSDMGKADTTFDTHCTASIGVAVFHGSQASQDNLISRADAAMYRAKRDGRSLIRFFEAKH